MKHSTPQQAAADIVQIIESGTYINLRGEVVSVREATDLAVKNSVLLRAEDFPAAFDLEPISVGSRSGAK